MRAGVISNSVTLSPRDYETLRRSFQDIHRGRPILLDEGITWHAISDRAPASFEAYRFGLYGPRRFDWMPLLNVVGTLGLLALAALLGWAGLR